MDTKARHFDGMRLVAEEKAQLLSDALQLVLPLAKGYAAIHSEVESNRRYVAVAEAALSPTPPASETNEGGKHEV